MSTVSRLGSALRPVARPMLGSVIARSAQTGLDVLMVAALAWLVATTAGGDVASPWPWLAALAVAAALKALARYFEQYLGHYVAFGLLAAMRVDFFQALKGLVPAGVADLSSGDLVDRATTDVDRVEVFYAHTLAPAVTGYLIPIAAALTVGLVVDAGMGVVIGTGVLLAGVVVPGLGRRLGREPAENAARAGGKLAAYLADGIRGLGDVSRLGAGPRRLRHLAALSGSVAESEAVAARRDGARVALFDLVEGMTLLAVAWVGAGRAEAGDLAAAAVGVAVTLVAFVPLRDVQQVKTALDRAMASAERVFAVMDRGQIVTDPARPAWVMSGQPELTFDSVDFSYPRRGQVLTDVSIEVSPGRRVGVVGPSGAGKSTLVSLATRFWDVTSGEVRVGGERVANVPLSWLRSQVGVVGQHAHVFSGSIADNISLGRPDADRPQIEEAARLAAAHDFVTELPDGYDSLVGASGSGLSGGQRQRLAIARALLGSSPILILDEATADLDVDSEQAVMDGLSRIGPGRGILIIAHRLTTVVDADEIVVLDGGRVVERGSHAALLDANRLYARLWAHQFDTLP
ncbi:MAG TPA: ABC transporter ATP-binding protein [Acidimicrobiia bacterium]|nr:ABC transporter ATP-binding protein [Acidimicrobiia bacterium]